MNFKRNLKNLLKFYKIINNLMMLVIFFIKFKKLMNTKRILKLLLIDKK